MKDHNQFINFNFDISSYRLLGRELITDRITALFEIVKNSYDANADNVEVNFIDVNPYSDKSKIIIKDDGIGMNLSDLKQKWMIIGTSNKRRHRTSPPPYNRKVVGKKGVGRFAVDLLGSKLTLKTKKKGDKQWVYLETNWSYYSEVENQQLTLPFDGKKDFFTDIKNKYWLEDGNINEQGTILEIEKIQQWTKYDIKRAYKELAKLVPPNSKIASQFPFNIQIDSPFPDFQKKKVEPLSIIKHSTISISISHNKEKGIQEIIIHERGELIKKEVLKKSFGFINFTLYYFNKVDKKKFKDQYNIDIDGVKIYRDGIITTPFAEYESNQLKQKDILGIDKRRYSGFFDRLNSRDLLGYIELKDEDNPNIIETTNRQDFIDNPEWRDLKSFIIENIEQVEKYLLFDREKTRSKTKGELGGANHDLKLIKKNISEIKKTASPDIKIKLKGIEADLGKLQGTVNKSIKDYAKLEEESKQKEDLFFSLVSLQTYAAMFSHMTKHTIGRVLRQAEYFYKYFPDESKNVRFKSISNRVFNEFITLRDGVNFMLKYAQSTTELEEISLSDLVKNLLENLYKDIFEKENIKTEIDINKNLVLNYNKKALEDIFDNLISNSIKGLKGANKKIIKISTIVENDELTLYFSDNGMGIPEEDKYRIFDIFFTKTADEGGAGLGLYMVKTRIESMRGKIELVDNEFTPTGATFKIVLPFQK